MSARSRNSYHAGYRPSQIAHHEWRNAENSAAYLLPTLERLTKVNPGLKLLDVGAGSGTITASLAKYIPQGSLVATDISDEVLARAESFARAAGATNVTCQKADIYNLPFPNASFDVTHASQVLCHLSRPEEALAEMMRVTKPGGVVACRESDLRTVCVWPDLPEIMQTYDLIARVMEQGGGHGKGGRQLVSWAMRAGIPRDHIKFSYGSWTYAEPADREVWGMFFLISCFCISLHGSSHV